MKEYQKRLIEERDELEQKYNSLTSYLKIKIKESINDSLDMDGGEEMLELLSEQQIMMRFYLQTLNKRIKLLNLQ